MLLWILEDHKELQSVMRAVARTRGHDCIAFSTLSEAWQELNAPSQAPHLVISDLILGAERSERWMLAVRARFPNAKLVCFSGSLDETISALLARHDILTIPKPASLFSVFELLEAADSI